ncbi:MAG: hypothetical protein C5B51_31255 [Terriglobia bacterium]|nr:MAG: hypothetical protein C5B51_31255 [Terriglobia bacterium]
MRIISNSIMAVLVIVALFWGNCFSCPQVLLAAQAHRCCHHTKAPAAGCQLQNLQSYVKAPAADHAVPAASKFAEPIAPVVAWRNETSPPIPIDVTPPDLIPLRI